ncbi:MAG: DUF2779 domain-containing protein [Myxococcota bacterium]
MSFRITRRLIESTRGCPLRLWRAVHEEHAEPILLRSSPGYLAELRLVYAQTVPDGVIGFEPTAPQDEVAVNTRYALDDPDVPGVMAGVLDVGDVRVRLHAVHREPDGSYTLVALRAARKVKPADLRRLAMQALAFELDDRAVCRTLVVYLSRDAVSSGPVSTDPVERTRFLAVRDVTDKVFERLPALREEVEHARRVLSLPVPPVAALGRTCYHASGCSHLTRCGEPPEVVEIAQLPKVDRQMAAELVARGATGLEDVFRFMKKPSRLQKRVRDALAHNAAHTGDALKPFLEELTYPLHFIDFELYAPAFPRYPDTRAFEQIPMQWSVHRLDADGSLTHHGYVHVSSDDPHEAFAQSLVAALGHTGTVLAWSDSEDRLLAQLSTRLSHVAGDLESVRARLVDLQAVVRKQVYEPTFKGSFSLKKVLPALVEGAGWHGLAIADGHAAQLAWDTFTHASPTTRQQLAERLTVYCQRDTEAMVWLHAALVTRCGAEVAATVSKPVEDVA